MSIDLVSEIPIKIDRLKNFNFKGISVDSAPDKDSVILTDGTNYLWAIATSDVLFGRLDKNGNFQIENEGIDGVLFTMYMGNRPEKIILAIEEYFGTKLISEGNGDFFKYVTY